MIATAVFLSGPRKGERFRFDFPRYLGIAAGDKIEGAGLPAPIKVERVEEDAA